MTITFFVPARGGSKGIKDKNVTLLCGKPLIYWVLNALEKSDYADKNIVVATDSEKIKQTVLNFGFSDVQVYDRNIVNAQDTSTTVDVVLEYIEAKKLADENLFCVVQATSPLLQECDVNGFIKNFLENDCESSFSGVEFPRICWTGDGAPICHDWKVRKRRQDTSKHVVVENGAMYINSVKNIRNNQSLLCPKVLPYIMPYETIVEIDEPTDLVKAEELLKKRVRPNLQDYKLFLMDCDGVLTDGGMYYGKNGEALKKFNTLDGAGISIIQKSGLIPMIVTGESSKFAIERAKKLGIECFSGVKDKLVCVKEIAKKYNTDLKNIVYIGDDLNDFEVIQNVGFSACPSSAQKIIKQNVNYITYLKGGEGAVRELVDFLIS